MARPLRITCPGATRHYREALGSSMDRRIGYDFALARVRHLRMFGA